MAQAPRDGNFVPTVLLESSTNAGTVLSAKGDQSTGRLLVDSASGSGTVTSVSVTSANGFAGSVATATTTPAITLTTTITGLIKGNGTAISAATAGTDYADLAFKTISVSGQSDVVADSAADTLTLIAGTNVTITTNAATDAITINAALSGAATTALDNLAAVAINAALVLATNDAFALGSATKMWSDLFLASGAVINFNNGNMTITHAAASLTIAGGPLIVPANGLTINATNVTSTGVQLNYLNAATGTTGTTTTNVVFSTSPVLTTPNIGAATATTINGLALTASTGTITITNAKTLAVTNTLTFSGTDSTVMTFPSTTATIARTDAGQTFTGTQILAENASIQLDPAGSADGKFTGITVTGTAGATLAFGDLIYLAVATSKWVLTDADAAATAGGVMMGMCVLAAAADGSATTVLLQGIIRADAKFPALTVGAAVYVGETAGAIQVAIPTGADNIIRVVGFAMTADEIYFNPSQDHQVTVA